MAATPSQVRAATGLMFWPEPGTSTAHLIDATWYGDHDTVAVEYQGQDGTWSVLVNGDVAGVVRNAQQAWNRACALADHHKAVLTHIGGTAVTVPGPRMPEFPIKGKDALAVEAIQLYIGLCLKYGLYEQAKQAELALDEMRKWQAANPDQVKLPSHTHVPAGTQPLD